MIDYIHVEITGTDQGIPQGQCSYKPQSQIVACTLDDMQLISVMTGYDTNRYIFQIHHHRNCHLHHLNSSHQSPEVN